MEPQHGIIGMSGIRSFKEDLVLKSTLSHANSKIFVTEEHRVPQVSSKNLRESEMAVRSDMNELGLGKKKLSTGSIGLGSASVSPGKAN